MLSSMVHSLGINMGPAIDLLRNNPQSQPYGYWEDQSFVSINRQIIKAAGGSWHNPPGRLKVLTASVEFRDQISELIETRNELDNWGWKDPRNCLCIECYQYVLQQLPDVRYVHIIRDKGTIADSLIWRGDVLQNSKQRQERIEWQKVIEAHERRVRGFFNRYQVRRYTVAYEDILKHPKYEVKQLATFLGIDDNDLIETNKKRIRY